MNLKFFMWVGLSAAMSANAQNVFPTAVGTSVGIGTSTPTARLEVNSGTAGATGIKLSTVTSSSSTVTGNGKALSVDASGNVILTPIQNSASNIYSANGTLSSSRTMTMSGRSLTFNPSTANSQFYVDGTSGKIGIGTTAPFANLDVKGGLPNGATFANSAERYLKSTALNVGSLVSGSTTNRNLMFYDIPQSNLNPKSTVHLAIEDRDNYNRLRLVAEATGTTWFGLSNRLQQEIFTLYENNDDVRFVLPMANSYMGIGTTSITDGTDTFRLSVKGAIRADRVKVYTTWADYVFEENYHLPTLIEVENHIKEKGHLLDIPSAAHVEKNGIELGEMNKLLLQKVEELTLYIIQMNKELQEVKDQINKN